MKGNAKTTIKQLLCLVQEALRSIANKVNHLLSELSYALKEALAIISIAKGALQNKKPTAGLNILSLILAISSLVKFIHTVLKKRQERKRINDKKIKDKKLKNKKKSTKETKLKLIIDTPKLVAQPQPKAKLLAKVLELELKPRPITELLTEIEQVIPKLSVEQKFDQRLEEVKNTIDDLNIKLTQEEQYNRELEAYMLMQALTLEKLHTAAQKADMEAKLIERSARTDRDAKNKKKAQLRMKINMVSSLQPQQSKSSYYSNLK